MNNKKKEPAKDKDKEREVSEQEALEQLREAIDQMTVKEHAVQMIANLAALAYKKLGLPEEPNKKYRDPKQAKQAIDCLSALVDTLETDFDEDEAKAFKGVVANLKLAYASQSKG